MSFTQTETVLKGCNAEIQPSWTTFVIL